MDSGGQYAVLGLAILMLTLSASNWDMIPTTQYSIHHRMLYISNLFNVLYLYRYSNSSQLIWSTNMYSTSSDRCFGSRNSCPSSSVTSCTHYNDVSVVCSKYTYSLSVLMVITNAMLLQFASLAKYHKNYY